MTRVINILSGPGAGKSTLASGLFHHMKMVGESVEYVTEYAKDLTWENSQTRLANQIVVFAEQFHRQWRLLGKVDYIITDSPLLLSAVYQTSDPNLSWQYEVQQRAFYLASFEEFDNINLFVERQKVYVPVGRNQTEEEAKKIDNVILFELNYIGAKYEKVRAYDYSIKEIYEKYIQGK